MTYLQGPGTRIAEILQAAKEQRSLPHFVLARSIKANVSVKVEPVMSKNVVAIHPGDSPQLRDEYVVISAHLDHLGTGKPVNGDGIYNGAMYDASGGASLI